MRFNWTKHESEEKSHSPIGAAGYLSFHVVFIINWVWPKRQGTSEFSSISYPSIPINNHLELDTSEINFSVGLVSFIMVGTDITDIIGRDW